MEHCRDAAVSWAACPGSGSQWIFREHKPSLSPGPPQWLNPGIQEQVLSHPPAHKSLFMAHSCFPEYLSAAWVQVRMDWRWEETKLASHVNSVGGHRALKSDVTLEQIKEKKSSNPQGRLEKIEMWSLWLIRSIINSTEHSRYLCGCTGEDLQKPRSTFGEGRYT